MLLAWGAFAAGAQAQALPVDPAALPSGGVEVGAGPEGVTLGTGDSGGVGVSAGPGGVSLGLAPAPTGAVLPPLPAPGAGTTAPGGGGDRAEAPTSPVAPPSGTAGRSGSGATAERSGRAGARAGQGPESRAGADSAAPRALDARPAAERGGRDGRGTVAPFFDLVERIPPAVRAGIGALALIALAMWAAWVRGRRRLERNAYLDPDSEVANMTAFEQILERQWRHAERYRRPLGLLLLDVERRDPGGIRLLGEREARDVAEEIGRAVRESDTVARLAPSRFAVVCPEAPQGSVETLAHAIEHRLEERRLRCRAAFGERASSDRRPAELVARAAAGLAGVDDESPYAARPRPVPRVAAAAPGPAGDRAAA